MEWSNVFVDDLVRFRSCLSITRKFARPAFTAHCFSRIGTGSGAHTIHKKAVI